MSRGSRRRQTKQKSPKSSQNSWINNPGVRTYGIAAIVVGAIVTLVVFGLQNAASGDFEFTMYQGGEAVGGNEVNFDDLFPSDKPVVLNFWAGLCPPCRAEMPGFQSVYEQYKGEFVLLGIDVGPFVGLGSNQDARNLLSELNITYPTGYAHDRDPVAQFGVTSMPTTVFFNPDGSIATRALGFLDQQRMTELVHGLVQTNMASLPAEQR